MNAQEIQNEIKRQMDLCHQAALSHLKTFQRRRVRDMADTCTRMSIGCPECPFRQRQSAAAVASSDITWH